MRTVSTIIAITLALCSTTHAQWVCNGNSCRYVPPVSYAPAPTITTYSTVPAVMTRPVFNTSVDALGTHRAYNTVTGANWRWDAGYQSWIYEGNSLAQPVVVEQAAIIEERRVISSPWRTRATYRTDRCQCGCGCVGCNCGR